MEKVQDTFKNGSINNSQSNGVSRCFFGQKNAFKIQYSFEQKAIFISIGVKKENGEWDWKGAKIKDIEAGEILRILCGKAESVSFYHTFNGRSNRIWINQKDENTIIRIEKYSKALNSGEQEVLFILLQEAIRLSLKDNN